MDYLTNKYDLDSYQEKRHFGGNDSTLNSLGLGTGVKRTRYGEPDPWSSILLGSRPMDSNNTYTLHVEGYNELLIMRAQYLHAYRPGHLLIEMHNVLMVPVISQCSQLIVRISQMVLGSFK